jgi:methylmalonyl-CoA mutase, N-terminal domain
MRSPSRSRIDLLQLDEGPERAQRERLSELRRRRDGDAAAKALDAVRESARGDENTMPYILDAVRARATLGEICEALRDVFGSYQERNAA